MGQVQAVFHAVEGTWVLSNFGTSRMYLPYVSIREAGLPGEWGSALCTVARLVGTVYVRHLQRKADGRADLRWHQPA